MRVQEMRGQLPIFKRPLSNEHELLKKIRSAHSLQLPQIYTKSLRQKSARVSLENPNIVRSQLSKVISFRKEKLACLLPSITDKLPEQVRAVSYKSDKYAETLALVNRIFGCCDLVLKEKDILVAEGVRSQLTYIFVTNFGYHPSSLCCNQTVIMRLVQKQGIESQDEQSQFIIKCSLLCLGCNKTMLNIVQKQSGKQREGNHAKKKRLLDFALHIASGRYKKSRIQPDFLSESVSRTKINDSTSCVRSRVQRSRIELIQQSLS